MGHMLSCSEGEDHVLHIWVRRLMQNIMHTRNMTDDYIGWWSQIQRVMGRDGLSMRLFVDAPGMSIGVASGTW
jgi:hypothetical protein